MKTLLVMARASNLLKANKIEDPGEAAILDAVQQAEKHLWRITTTVLGPTLIASFNAIVDTTTGYDLNSDGIYPLPTGIPFHRLAEIRINDQPATRYRTSDQLEGYGTTTYPAYRIIAPAATGAASRLEIYPAPATAAVILFEYRQQPRVPDIFRDAVGTLSRTLKTWSKSSGLWNYAANELVGATWSLMDQGEVFDLAISANDADGIVTLDNITGTGTRADLRCEFDIPTELTEEVAVFIPAAALEIIKYGAVSKSLERKIRQALSDLDEPEETIPSPPPPKQWGALTGSGATTSRRPDNYEHF